jgi:hypothetical protein
MAFQVPQAIAQKYMAKQPAGFCQFLASIGAVQNVDACIQGQTAYLQSKDAMQHWARGLYAYGRLVQGGMATAR